MSECFFDKQIEGVFSKMEPVICKTMSSSSGARVQNSQPTF